MKARRVVLEMGELAAAAGVGKLRQAEAERQGKKDSHSLTHWQGSAVQGDASLHVYGAQGELAAAKALNLYPKFDVNGWHDPDLEPGIQVRARLRKYGELIVRKVDNPDHNYVLVTGEGPEFWVVGWMAGREAMQDKYLSAPGGRPPAWFVPITDLHPLETLPVGVLHEAA